MIMSKDDKHRLFEKYKFDDYKFNYKDFITHLNDFEFKVNYIILKVGEFY